jgi:prepilin-type N-terminal cleavage/methylation domain-containing protein
MLKQQSGFTLIELIMVLALTSGFAILALSSFTVLRDQSQFNDSLTRLQSEVLAQRQEALSTIELTGGTNAGSVTLGKLMEFTPGSSTVQIRTLVTANTEAPSADQAVAVDTKQNAQFQMPWGAVYDSSAQPLAIAFTRSLSDGSLRTAIITPSAAYTYGDFVTSTSVANLSINGSGQKGQLTVDPISGGVTVVFQ